MVRLLRQFLNDEKGQALVIVLGLLALGGLTIAVSLNYATTNLKGSQIIAEKTKGVYAADAGVGYAFWALTHDEWSIDPYDDPLVTELSENINGMAVGIETENKGTFTLYLGELIESSPPQVNIHWIDVIGSITELGGDVYQYTITVTWQPEAAQVVYLEEVGARLPVGYSYQAGSAALYTENLSTSDPTSNEVDQYGAYMPTWDLGSPAPGVSSDNTTAYQIFNITGTGSTSGHYACVEGQPNSVGPVGEIKGTRYRITATATRSGDGRTTAEIVSDIMIGDDETIDMNSWQITN
ncbi:hypothetical protein ACFLUR_04040 [Chloroflexota bacterium]